MKHFIKVTGGFDGGIESITTEIVIVPDKYVDGTHTRNVMSKKEFPIKVQVLSTGHILDVYGFQGEYMIYSSEYKLDGAYIGSEGKYKGVLGKDFLYI